MDKKKKNIDWKSIGAGAAVGAGAGYMVIAKTPKGASKGAIIGAAAAMLGPYVSDMLDGDDKKKKGS